MTIVYDHLVNLKIPEIEHIYTCKDSILYALGVGIGVQLVDSRELPFVYERDCKALPTFAVVLAHPGFWIRDLDTGIDWKKVVHGEQELTLHKPLPPRGTVIGRNRVVDVIDKGTGRGALVISERTLHEKGTEEPIATVLQTAFCRGDGGCGGPQRASSTAHVPPSRLPDYICEVGTSMQAALIYRLSGDYNPLHVDPEVAFTAGFPKPILHGLATYGIAGYAIVKTICDYRPERLASVAARFTAPVFPGETLRVEMWRDELSISFQVRCVERDVLAITGGRAGLRE